MSGGSSDLSAPEPIADHHDLEAFDSGEPELDSWLRRRALANEREHASRTFVVCSGRVVVGYYCLAAGSVTHADAPGSIRRNMPQPIPVIVLGRLAADRRWSGKGIGAGLLKDAVLRSLQVTQEIAARALLVHAISEPARRFYLKFDFIESPIDPMTLMLNLSKLPSARPSRRRELIARRALRRMQPGEMNIDPIEGECFSTELGGATVGKTYGFRRVLAVFGE